MEDVQEVSNEDQAVMAMKLADNVRELIRKELKAALEDVGFVTTVNTYALANVLVFNLTNQPAFQANIKQTIKTAII